MLHIIIHKFQQTVNPDVNHFLFTSVREKDKYITIFQKKSIHEMKLGLRY